MTKVDDPEGGRKAVAKYQSRLKDFITKVDAAVAEMSRARDKYAVAAPNGATPDEIKNYDSYRKEAFQRFNIADRHVASVKKECANLLLAVKSLPHRG